MYREESGLGYSVLIAAEGQKVPRCLILQLPFRYVTEVGFNDRNTWTYWAVKR